MNSPITLSRKNIILLLGVLVAVVIGITSLVYETSPEATPTEPTSNEWQEQEESETTIGFKMIYIVAEKGQRVLQLLRSL